MNLPYRLKKITEIVPPSETIADIGCDHAYVSIELVKSGKVQRALACDVNEGPLKSARQNIITEGLSSQIETRLSDGLKEVITHEADTVIIAGMGGLLMERILTGRLEDFDTFVLSPQSDIEHFRHFLIDNNMLITDECMLIDDRKFYTIMTVVPKKRLDTDSHINDTSSYYQKDEDFIYGGLLIHKKDEILHQFLLKEQTRFESILQRTTNEDIQKSLKYCLKALEAYTC